MTYEEQLKIEQLNKEIINNILKNVKSEEFISYYINHNQKETCEHFGLRTTKQLTKVLKIFNYDFSKPKPSKFKGKPAARTHESYIAGGKKSAETQKEAWAAKSKEEKDIWSQKQKEAHSTDEFKSAIKQINKDYWNSLSYEERCAINQKKSKTAKSNWSKLSAAEQELIMANRFKNGRCYNSKSSKPNEHFANWLQSLNIEYEQEFCLDQKRFDFKIGDILIEIDPWSTHNSTFAPFECHRGPLEKTYHKAKTETAIKYNYRCIHIFDWDNLEKLKPFLLKDANKIGARECVVKEVHKEEAKTFINTFHLQNYAKDEIRLGLYHDNKLVSIMTFGKPRYNKNYEYELIRYCSALNITGGAEKLFKAFVTKYLPNSILSYCDLSKFSGSTYEKLGFTLLNNPAPSRHWYNPTKRLHFTDNLLRQQGFSRLVHHCDAKNDNLDCSDNAKLMLNAGFVEIYDCGQATYIWKKETP